MKVELKLTGPDDAQVIKNLWPLYLHDLSEFDGSVLDRHRGRWEVVTYPNHGRAVAFWRRALGAYAPHRVHESEGENAWGRKVIFRFENEL